MVTSLKKLRKSKIHAVIRFLHATGSWPPKDFMIHDRIVKYVAHTRGMGVGGLDLAHRIVCHKNHTQGRFGMAKGQDF